jgi:hypothetical protein
MRGCRSVTLCLCTTPTDGLVEKRKISAKNGSGDVILIFPADQRSKFLEQIFRMYDARFSAPRLPEGSIPQI